MLLRCPCETEFALVRSQAQAGVRHPGHPVALLCTMLVAVVVGGGLLISSAAGVACGSNSVTQDVAQGMVTLQLAAAKVTMRHARLCCAVPHFLRSPHAG